MCVYIYIYILHAKLEYVSKYHACTSSGAEISPLFIISKTNQSHISPEVPRGFQEIKVPKIT